MGGGITPTFLQFFNLHKLILNLHSNQRYEKIIVIIMLTFTPKMYKIIMWLPTTVKVPAGCNILCQRIYTDSHLLYAM